MLIASVLGAAAEVFAFAVGAYVVAWVGKTLFQAEVTFDEMVRALGLAYVWRIVGVLGALGGLIPALGLLLFPILCVAAILSIASWFVATREALDLDTGQTIITVLLGWVAIVVINIVLGAIIGLLGSTVSTISSGFSS
ncbi:MAG: hypothetical protein O3B43_04870 [Chloroflexi bacterium]|nr:hypothetical protein [Chloroflexota bacterium]